MRLRALRGLVPTLLALGLGVPTASLAAPGRALAPVSRTLPNGLRVVVFPRPGVHVVQLQLQAAAGMRAEAAGHDGLASLTAQMMRQGTTSRAPGDVQAGLDSLGATLAISVTRDAAEVGAGCRAEEFEGVLEIVSDLVINPLFSDESFQAVRRQAASQLGAQTKNPSSLADESATALAFGAHPYGHAPLGTLGSLVGVSREQVREFHRDHWRPDAAVLAVAGDIDPQQAFNLASEWFGRWTGHGVVEAARPATDAKPGVWLLDLPGSPLTEIRALMVGPGRTAPGYAGWVVLREALEAGSLPAGARSVLSAGRDASLLMVSASARPESAAVQAGRLRDALRSATTSAPPEAKLAAARKRAAQGWAFTVETLGQLLSSWLAGDVAGLPADHLVGAADALGAAAWPALGGKPVTLLVAGPAERMQASLSSLGRIDTVRAKAQEPPAKRAVVFTPEQRKQGRTLVGQALAAHGGAAKLDAVTMSELDGDLTMEVAGQQVSGESRYLRVDPARFVSVMRVLDLEHRQVLDGKRGWALTTAKDSASMVPADSTTLMSLRASLESDLVHLLRAASDPGSNVAFAGKVEMDSKPCDQVEFDSRENGPVRLSLDAVTHRVVGVEMQPTPQGAWRDRRRWSEFVQAEGIWWPRRESHEIDGETVASTILRRIFVNRTVDSTLFMRPLVVQGQIRGHE
jgi:predicted Zn-dependent peptidase